MEEEPDGDGGCESGVVCRGMVLPADIFIGGHATCNRARGIRTERCFVHLYPPIRRQPSLLLRFPPSPRALTATAFLLLSAEGPRQRAHSLYPNTGMTYWLGHVFGVLRWLAIVQPAFRKLWEIRGQPFASERHFLNTGRKVAPSTTRKGVVK